MRGRLNSQMFFFIILLLWKSYWKEQRCFEFVLCNRINLLFLHLCVKSELEEQRSHKVVTVMSIEFDLLLLVSLQIKISRVYHCEWNDAIFVWGGLSKLRSMSLEQYCRVRVSKSTVHLKTKIYKIYQRYSFQKMLLYI